MHFSDIDGMVLSTSSLYGIAHSQLFIVSGYSLFVFDIIRSFIVQFQMACYNLN